MNARIFLYSKLPLCPQPFLAGCTSTLHGMRAAFCLGEAMKEMPHLTEIEIAWLAGLLEGEGSFHFTMVGKCPNNRIQLSMTDKDIMERVAKMFFTTFSTLPPQGLMRKDKNYYRVYICGANSRAVMRAIRPFMGQRRKKEIDKQLAAWETRQTKTRKDKRFLIYRRSKHSLGGFRPGRRKNENQKRGLSKGFCGN